MSGIFSTRISVGFQVRAVREAERTDDGRPAQRNRRPINHDAPEPVAPARDTPDVIECRLDAGEHPDGDIDEQQHSDHAERAAVAPSDEFVNPISPSPFAR